MQLAPLFLFLLYFFPVANIGIKIPSLLIALSFYLIFKPRSLYISKIFLFLFFYIILLFLYYSLNKDVPLYDFFYAFIPIFAILNQSYSRILCEQNLSGTKLAIKAIVLIQFSLMLLQIINIGQYAPIFDDIFYFYYSIGDATDLFGSQDMRPSGILINAPTAGIIMYLLLRSLYVIERRVIYLILIFIALFLTGWRLGLLIFICYDIVYANLLSSRRFLARAILFACIPLFMFLFYAIDINQLFPKLMIWDVISNLNYQAIVEGFSYTNRLQALQFWLDNFSTYLFGGFTSDQIQNYGYAFDSELLLRSLQFGFIGLCLFWLGHITPLLSKRLYLSRDGQFLVFFLLSTSVTVTTSTNVFVLPYIALYTFMVITAHNSDMTDKETLEPSRAI